MTKDPRMKFELMVEMIYPDYLGMTADRVSEYCYTIIVLDCDFKYKTWMANLSDDDRWTLSPVDVPELPGQVVRDF